MRLYDGPYDGMDMTQEDIDQLAKTHPLGFIFLPPLECLDAIRAGEMTKDQKHRDRSCYEIQEREGERVGVYDHLMERFAVRQRDFMQGS